MLSAVASTPAETEFITFGPVHLDVGSLDDSPGFWRDLGRLVTSAALILFLAFASLASAPNKDIKVLATGLGVGILLDATVVRGLLLPALGSLIGRWNWWMPQPLAHVLRVQPSVPPRALEAGA